MGTAVSRRVYSVSQHKTHNTSSPEIEDFRAVYMLLSAFLTLRLLMSYIYGAPILDVSRSHTTTQHSR